MFQDLPFPKISWKFIHHFLSNMHYQSKGAPVVTNAMLRRLTNWRFIIIKGKASGVKPWRCVSLDSRHQLALRGEEVRNLILGSLPLLV